MNRLLSSIISSMITLLILASCTSTQTPTSVTPADPAVEISSSQTGDALEIVASGQKISLQANSNSASVSFHWKLVGSGSLTSDSDPVIQYEAPQSVDVEEEVTVIVTVTDPSTGNAKDDYIIIRLLPSATSSSQTPPPATVDTPSTESPVSSAEAIVLDTAGFLVQPSGGQDEFFLDMRPDGDCVDLSGYTIEMTFQGAEGMQVQLFFKNAQFRNVYAFPTSFISGQPVRFDPAVDDRNVDEFDDFSCIAAVGAKIWGGAQGVQITSARLFKP